MIMIPILVVTFHLVQEASDACKQTPRPAQICLEAQHPQECKPATVLCDNPAPKVDILKAIQMQMTYGHCVTGGFQQATAIYMQNVENIEFYQPVRYACTDPKDPAQTKVYGSITD
jgi:hypothetical protein